MSNEGNNSEQMVPLSRLNEVLAAQRAAESQVAALTQQLADAQAAPQETGELDDLRAQFANLQQSLETTQADLATERLANLRTRAATEAGIPATLAGRLQGDDYEALLADAQGLAGLIPAKPAGSLPAPNGTPTGLAGMNLSDPKWVRDNMQTILQA